MSNSKELKVKYHGNKEKKSRGRKKNPNVANMSALGYGDGSPYRSLPYIDIDTPSGRIDMSNTGIPLWANGRILPPYSGIHQFDSETVREIPLAQTGGRAGSLVGTDPRWLARFLKKYTINGIAPIAFNLDAVDEEDMHLPIYADRPKLDMVPAQIRELKQIPTSYDNMQPVARPVPPAPEFVNFTAAGQPMVDVRTGETTEVPTGYHIVTDEKGIRRLSEKEKNYRLNKKQTGGSLPMAQVGGPAVPREEGYYDFNQVPEEHSFYNMGRAKQLYSPDKGGHWPSIDYETGEWLKSKQHPTAWMEYLYGHTLNPQQALNYDVRINPQGYFGENTLQYVKKVPPGSENAPLLDHRFPIATPGKGPVDMRFPIARPREMKQMLDKISRSKRMPKVPKSKLILQDNLLFPVDDAGLPAPGNPVDRDIYIKNLPPVQWLQERNQWLKDNPQQQPMMEARHGGWLKEYQGTEGGSETVPPPPASYYKRLYGHKDYPRGNVTYLPDGTKVTAKGYVDPRTGYLYFSDKENLDRETGDYVKSSQEAKVPEHLWNTSRFLFDPFIMANDQGIHNAIYQDTEKGPVYIKGDVGVVTPDSSMKDRFGAAKQDITNYYKYDLGLGEKDVRRNVRGKMKDLRQMYNARKAMGDWHHRDFQEELVHGVFDEAVDKEGLYFSPKSALNPGQAKRAYVKFQKAWRDTPGREARKNARQELRDARMRYDQYSSDLQNQPIGPEPYRPDSYSPYKSGGSKLPMHQVPPGQFKVPASERDSVKNMAYKTMQYEQQRGSAFGTGLSDFGNPKLPAGANINQAVDWYMDNIYPQLGAYSTAMEKAEAGDFLYNSGKDARPYAIQEYLRKTDPQNKTGWQDASGNWKDRKDPSKWDTYWSEIQKLPTNDRRVFINKGRDWYYQNINNPSPGVPSDAYGNTWYGRIWNTNDYAPYNPNNPKFTPKQKSGGSKLRRHQTAPGQTGSFINYNAALNQANSSFQPSNTRTAVPAQAAVKNAAFVKRQDAEKLSDEAFKEKYGIGKHRYMYETDPAYKAAVDKEIRAKEAAGMPMIKKTVKVNPNLMFMAPNATNAEQAQNVIDYNLLVQGAMLPIPGVQAVGKVPGVFDAASGLLAASKESGLLSKLYKLNPLAVKENPYMYLYRARPVGQNIDMNMAAQMRAKEAAGESLTWYQKNLLNPQTNPQLLAREKYYGQWFEKDPSRLDFYMNRGTRNFADQDAIEILRTRLPKSEADKLNVSQFPDAKVLSASPETEFILPKDVVGSAERFPESSLQQLIQEDKKFNTPHWLKGYREVPIELPGSPNASYMSKGDVAGTVDFGYYPKLTLQEKLKVLFMDNYKKQEFLANKTVDEAFEYADRFMKDPEYLKRFQEVKSMTPSIAADEADVIKYIREKFKSGEFKSKDFTKEDVMKMTDSEIKDAFEDIYRNNTSGVAYYDKDKLSVYKNRTSQTPQQTSVQHLKKNIVIDPYSDKKYGLYAPNKFGSTANKSSEQVTVGGRNLGDLFTVTVHEILGHGKTYGSISLTQKEKELLKSVFKANHAASEYIQSPSEVMARIDEIRTVLNRDNPFNPVTEADLTKYEKMVNTSKSMPGVDEKTGSSMLQFIQNVDKKKLARVMNTMYGFVPPVLLGAGAMEEKRKGGSKLPPHLPEAYRTGGWLKEYQGTDGSSQVVSGRPTMQGVLRVAEEQKKKQDAVDAASSKAKTVVTKDEKGETKIVANPNYGKKPEQIKAERDAQITYQNRVEHLAENPQDWNLQRDYLGMGINEPAVEYVPVESVLLPASLPFRSTSLLGKTAIGTAEMVNPFSGFGINPGKVFKMAGRDEIDKKRLDALLDALKQQNQMQTRPITEDIVKEYGEGFDWVKDWYSDPETLKRWSDIGFSRSANLQRQLRGMQQGNFDVRMHPDVVGIKDDIGSYFSTSDRQLMNDLNIGPTGVIELYPHHPVHTTGNYIPEAGVSVPMSRATVSTHEGTHFVTKGDVADKYISPYTDEIYENVLSPEQKLLMSMFPDKPVFKGMTGKDINYLTSPSETYARINEIRRGMGLKPGQVVNDSDLKAFLTNNAKYTGLDDFSELVFKNPEGVRKLARAMNILPAAAGVGAVYGISGSEPQTETQMYRKGGPLKTYQTNGEVIDSQGPVRKVGIPTIEAGQNLPEVTVPLSQSPDQKSFPQAFREARNAGLKEFMWRGRLYNTKLASEVQTSKNKVLVPVRGSGATVPLADASFAPVTSTLESFRNQARANLSKEDQKFMMPAGKQDLDKYKKITKDVNVPKALPKTQTKTVTPGWISNRMQGQRSDYPEPTQVPVVEQPKPVFPFSIDTQRSQYPQTEPSPVQPQPKFPFSIETQRSQYPQVQEEQNIPVPGWLGEMMQTRRSDYPQPAPVVQQNQMRFPFPIETQRSSYPEIAAAPAAQQMPGYTMMVTDPSGSQVTSPVIPAVSPIMTIPQLNYGYDNTLAADATYAAPRSMTSSGITVPRPGAGLIPSFNMPEFNMPKFSMPDINMPKFSLPEFNMPDIDLPELSIEPIREGLKKADEVISKYGKKIAEPIGNLEQKIASMSDEAYQEFKTGLEVLSSYAEDITDPEVVKQWTLRGLEKYGIIDPVPEYKTKPSVVKEVKEKPKPETYFTLVEITPDKDYSETDKLMRYRSQWDNADGFEYIATGVRKDNSGFEADSTIGVGHFLLDASANPGTEYSHEYNKGFLASAKKHNDYVPVFTLSPKPGRVILKYKRANELTENDRIYSPLRQHVFDDIQWDKSKPARINSAGSPHPYVRTLLDPMYEKKYGRQPQLLYKNTHDRKNPTLKNQEDDMKAYGRFSGLSVVFIFNDKYGNTIVRDAGDSLTEIKKEGEAIKRDYNLKKGDLIMGYHDVGSFSAKPAAKNGKISSKQWRGFNTNSWVGGALIIPIQK